jgi:ectoine hydroxylase-related dioxygenase (phytanoyl-CoA dioxygenase family)
MSVQEATKGMIEEAPCIPGLTDDLDQARLDIERTGICLIKDAISATELQRVRTALDVACDEDIRYGAPSRLTGGDYDHHNQRIWGLLNRHRCFIDLVENERSVELLTSIVGPNFLLSSLSANITAPGHSGMTMHCDQQVVPEPWCAAPLSANVFWAIDDFTEENGGTLVAPGSHMQNRAPRERDAGALVPIVAPAGTMCVMEGRVWHKTGVNRTVGQRRAGVFGFYVAPHIRCQENWFLSLNPLVIQRGSEQLLRMLGYRVDGTHFGHVNGYEPLPTTLDW